MYPLKTNQFNEWQLGIMQAKANQINAVMHYDMEHKNVYLSQRGLLIFSWEFGKEPLVYVGTLPMTISEYVAALERLGVALADFAIIYLQGFEELLRGIRDGTGD